MEITETQEELFLSRLVFVRALDVLIPEGKGVFLEIDNSDFEYERVIVHNTENIIGVLDASERTDLKNGDWVSLIHEDNIVN